MQRFPLGEALWHKKGVKTSSRLRRAARPLDPGSIRELALRYAGRYATTQAKLRTYLERKLRERGWDGDEPPDLEAIASRFAELGYVDDAAYAMSQARSILGRGLGKRRLAQKLRMAGVEDIDSGEAQALAAAEAVDAALRFAGRRRLGPFAIAPADPRQRDKWIAAMVRAGHGFGLARAIATLPPGANVDAEELRDQLGREET